MTENPKPFTHNAYIFKNHGQPRRGQTKRPGWWQREGYARIEADGSFSVFLHSTPIGGFDGVIRCIEFGQPQPAEPTWLLAGGEAEPEPRRPGEGDESGD